MLDNNGDKTACLFHGNIYCWLWVVDVICSLLRVTDSERQSIVEASAVRFSVLQGQGEQDRSL
jgi:hypothetical protein